MRKAHGWTESPISATLTLHVLVTGDYDLDSDLGLDNPVCLRFEGLDLVMSLHTEAQRWGLAWAERDQRGVQIPVFSLKVLGLESEWRNENGLRTRTEWTTSDIAIKKSRKLFNNECQWNRWLFFFFLPFSNIRQATVRNNQRLFFFFFTDQRAHLLGFYWLIRPYYVYVGHSVHFLVLKVYNISR